MSEKDFVDRLKGTPFPKERYLSIGLDEDYIREKTSAYNPKLKEVLAQNTYINDPLARLVSDYDMSRTEIGMVRFGSNVSETEDYFCIGKFEVDFICVSKLSHEVVIVGFDDPLGIAYKCAQNSAMFLDAMIVAGKFLENCGVDKNLFNNQNSICLIAERCSDLAGGMDYLNFYKVLIGCES